MRRINLLVIIIMLFSFCACGDKGKEQENKKNDVIKSDTLTLLKLTDTVKVLNTDTEVSACHDAVLDILVTSPQYKSLADGLRDRVIKNGGSGFSIWTEGAPQLEPAMTMEISETYDFSVHENYPDHVPRIAAFTFDPKKKQLYELDIAEDTLMPIKFDKALLKKFEEACH